MIVPETSRRLRVLKTGRHCLLTCFNGSVHRGYSDKRKRDRRRWLSDVWQRSAFFQKARPPRPPPGFPFPPIERKACHTTDFFINYYCLETRTLNKLGQVVLSLVQSETGERDRERVPRDVFRLYFIPPSSKTHPPPSFIHPQAGTGHSLPPRRVSRITVEREQKHLKVSFTLMTMTNKGGDGRRRKWRARAHAETVERWILCSPRNSLPFLFSPRMLLDEGFRGSGSRASSVNRCPSIYWKTALCKLNVPTKWCVSISR